MGPVAVDALKKQRRAPDPRPARTRAAILEAVERLGEAKAEISIAAIVTEAQLSRSSFYSQFKDLGDVAVQLLTELFAEIEALYPRLRESGVEGEAAGRASTELLFTEIQRRRGLYAAVLGGAGASIVTQHRICEVIANTLLPAAVLQAPAGIHPGFASKYMAAGTLATLTDWLLEEEPTSIPEMQERLLSMTPRWLMG